MRKLLVASLGAVLIGGAVLATASLVPAQPAPALSQAQLQAHPDMARGIRELQNVVDQLQTKHPAYDFGGHRVKAIQLIQEAITQLQMGIAVAKKK